MELNGRKGNFVVIETGGDRVTIVLLCAGSALAGYIIGLLMADRIAVKRIEELRLQAGLDAETGLPDTEDDLYER